MATQTSQSTKSKQIELASRPDGEPTEANFKQTVVEIPPIADGEFLVKNEWMSVDPYMRGRMKAGDSYVPAFSIDQPLEGGCIGKVVESRHTSFKEGDYVLGTLGWREYWTSTGEGVTPISSDLVPVQAYLGVLGMTGMTAWVGLNRIANLSNNSTVFVSAASGAVGSVACQIAKAKDCRVIGSAGQPSKIEWLSGKIGIDAVINYKETDDLTAALREHAPDGIDVYFDNVGGDHLEAALEVMNDFGCCVECGMISTYNATEPPAAPRNLFKVVSKRIRMQGFIVRDHMSDQEEFTREMVSLIKSDKIVWEESIVSGLENAPAAFIGLFNGDNLGKQLVRID
ncbi:NADP-dependent oxidoreductase [Stieleria sp.]|uniref:NADP-dependent oxidoreductase n=1 Tax=Stieleria sp. TaxID=2795976 RepID=UPI0035626D65